MQINEIEKSKLDEYAKLINDYNKIMNLTGIDDYEGIYEKHYYDAYKVSNTIKNLDVKTVADVGTGMGVPGIVLAVLNPDISFYLIEPMKKRCEFLMVVLERLKLKNVTILNERSEEINLKVDLVVNRAVAKLNILTEICYNLIKDDGFLLAMKSKNLLSEIEQCNKAFKILGYEVVEIEEYNLKSDNSERKNILLKRTGLKNNKYPRVFKEIKRLPL